MNFRFIIGRRLQPMVYPAVLALVGGCFTPILSDPVRRTSTRASRTTNKPRVAAVDMLGSGSVQQLKVNGEMIEAQDLWLDHLAALGEKTESMDAKQRRAMLEREAVRLIRDRMAEALLYHEASLRLTPQLQSRLDSLVDAELRRRITTEYGGTQRGYERHLEAQGQSLERVRTKLQREIVIRSYLEQTIRLKVAEPTRTDLASAYEALAGEYRRAPRCRMSLIDIRIVDRLPSETNNPTRRQWSKAQEASRLLAQAALDAIRSGQSFEDVAKQHSDGLHAVEGGRWGWVTLESVRDRFRPAVEALYKLQEGEISPIIETEDDLFLVQCDEIDHGLEPDFQTLQPELIERHFQSTYNRNVTKLIEKLRAKARIEPPDLARFHAGVVEAGLKLLQNRK